MTSVVPSIAVMVTRLWREMADGIAHQRRQVLLVRAQRYKRMHALELGVVRSNLLVEMEGRRRALVAVRLFFYNGYARVIAGGFDRKCHEMAARVPFRPTWYTRAC